VQKRHKNAPHQHTNNIIFFVLLQSAHRRVFSVSWVKMRSLTNKFYKKYHILLILYEIFSNTTQDEYRAYRRHRISMPEMGKEALIQK
jgi:hypothetical protein